MTQTVRYDAAALKETMEERVHQYVTFRESLDVLREKMRAVTDLGEAFEGKAAEAIKRFFTAQIDVVDMWLQLVEQQIAFMEDVGAMAEDRKLGGSTKMDVPFLEDDLNAAHKRTADMIQQQHEDLSSILLRIRDLVSLEAYSPAQIELSMQDAKNKRDDTVEQMEELDQVLVDEYGLSVESETLILALIEGLLQATTQNGTFSPMSFNVNAYENSEAHAAIEASQQRSTEYIKHKQQLHEAREAQARQAELDARSGLEKFLDGTKNFVGEFSGYYDTVRASTGVDPVTGRELSASERTAAAAWAAAGIVPILGPASKVAKGGKAVFAVSKGSKAATAPLTAFKSSTQAFTRVSHAEKGIYGLVSANGLSGFFFGQDLLGNEVTAEQRTEMLMMGSMLPFGAGMKMVKGNGPDVLGVGVRGSKKTNEVIETNLSNISNFINGNKKFDEVIEDYAKVYKEKVDLNKPWSWDDTIPGGDSLSPAQKRKIKEVAVKERHIPDIKVMKVEGMRYGFADFASPGIVEKTVQLPKEFWKLSDKEQFKWLDEKIGGTRKGMTWHHTEVPGKMELVPFGIHNITPHNGGRTKGMWADSPR
ncbi:T7SS effector LXG polymorphic toxin [Jeotgalibacillus campisalis]|uniref:LXG domain-containing protein n=1 Tax=Jeotgalibacillus campisalis TaxID=220754 RepID=A0A0C2VEM0_9BACL|nr:T7SS effector LXG polymorphic toxin [Jeotgalibacillus campisalis]KIL42971.1 hypothetical protein KR50_33740 [Jeotgalibacillus campisalis]